MKGLRRVFALVLAIMLTLTTGLSVFASGTNTKLIKRSETVEGYAAVSNSSEATFSLQIKRESDTFEMYRLTEIQWTQNSEGVWNISVDWITPLKSWISTNPDFSDNKFKTPGALGLAGEGDIQIDENTTEKGYKYQEDTIKLLRAFREAMKSNTELKTSMNAYLAGYHRGAGVDDGNSVYSRENGLAAVTPVKTETKFENAYTVSQIPLGLIFVDAKGGTREYQPVLVNLVPKQVGPTGNWYIKKSIESSLKYEDLAITKKINGKDEDIVRIGEQVDFDVELDIPAYTKNGDNFEQTLYNAIDDMAQGYTLIPTSATLYFIDKEGNTYHPIAGIGTDDFGNATVSDQQGTYNAVMATGAKVFYSTTDDKNVFYATQIDDQGQYQFWGAINGNLEQLGQFTVSDNDSLNVTVFGDVLSSYNDKVSTDKQLKYSAANIKTRDYRKSFISVKVNYATLMTTLYMDDSDNESYKSLDGKPIVANKSGEKLVAEHVLFKPYKMKVQYKAVVNEHSYVGNNDNTNKVELYYIQDSMGNLGIAEDTVVGWTYAANVVKVDGRKYNSVQLTDADGNPLMDDDNNPVYDNSDAYIDKAHFDLYRLDTTYCGGAEATAKPEKDSEGKYSSTYTFYEDSDGNATFDAAKAKWAAADKNSILGAMVYNYTLNDTPGELLAKVKDIPTKIAAISTGTGNYSTLDNFETKYATFAANVDAYKKYVTPKISGDKVKFLYIPVEVDKCSKCETKHYHMQAYSLLWEDFQSTATEDGVRVTGLDENTYLLVETDAPAGYNKLSEAIQFVISKYDDDQYSAAGNSYKGFISDEKEEDGTNKNIDTGIYDILVKNYTGLTLPSTGGMGTLLFTIIGIMVMLLAIILVLKKNSAAKKAAGFMAFVLIVSMVVAPATEKVYAINEIEINDEYGQKVTGDQKTSFSIELKNPTDTVEVYKIAELKWNETANTYEEVKWATGLKNKIDLSSEYSEIASTPIKLGKAPVEKQIAFLDWVYENKGTNNVGQSGQVQPANMAINTVDKVTTCKVTNAGFGIYLVRAVNTSINKAYQLLTVDVMPTQQGPVGAWYLADEIKASLKFADIGADKTINGKAGDTVKTGDKVSFVIRGEVPDYPGVDVKAEDGTVTKDYSQYTFALTDTMSTAFEYNKSEGVTVEYTTKDYETAKTDDTTVWTALTTDYTWLFNTAAVDGNSEGLMRFEDTSGGKGLYCDVTKSGSDFTMKWYTYSESSGVLTYVKTTTGTSVPNQVTDSDIKTAYKTNLGVESASFTRTVATDWVNLQNVTFNFAKLHELGAKAVRISYSATVTSKAVVGEDTNTNTASFFYQKDLSGASGKKDATATAWTYSFTLKKQDGDTGAPLAGAKFSAYKQAYTFVPNASGIGNAAADYEHYTWSSNFNNIVTELAQEGVTLKSYNDSLTVEGHDKDAFYRNVAVSASETACSVHNCGGGTAAHTHIVVYTPFMCTVGENNLPSYEITSTDDATGITINGLEPASYVLIETSAPDGYNPLNEAIRFDINELTKEQAQALYSSDSLKGFVTDVEVKGVDLENPAITHVTVGDKEYQAYADGNYPIVVKNYKGITLPSTGGMGTLLFTMIGLIIMTLALVMVIMKRKSNKFSEF